MARILVIDDEPEVRRTVRRILEREGHQVDEAEDGKVALRRFAGDPADLVISDIYMPHMDGLELLIRLREAWPEAPFVMMTGGGHLSPDRLLEASQSLGATGTLEKPFTVDDLRRVVAEGLGKAGEG